MESGTCLPGSPQFWKCMGLLYHPMPFVAFAVQAGQTGCFQRHLAQGVTEQIASFVSWSLCAMLLIYENLLYIIVQLLFHVHSCLLSGYNSCKSKKAYLATNLKQASNIWKHVTGSEVRCHGGFREIPRCGGLGPHGAREWLGQETFFRCYLEEHPTDHMWGMGTLGHNSWTFLRYTKKCSETKNAHFQKKCYKPLKSAHLVVSFCRAPPHVQTAGSPRILATYTDTITLCLGSRCLGSPQPTSFAAASSKSSNSLGWAELDT